MSFERRGTLHRKDQAAFESFLRKEGFDLKETDSSMVIKAQHPRTKEWVIVYDGKSPDHFTVQKNMSRQVKRFIQAKHEAMYGS